MRAYSVYTEAITGRNGLRVALHAERQASNHPNRAMGRMFHTLDRPAVGGFKTPIDGLLVAPPHVIPTLSRMTDADDGIYALSSIRLFIRSCESTLPPASRARNIASSDAQELTSVKGIIALR